MDGQDMDNVCPFSFVHAITSHHSNQWHFLVSSAQRQRLALELKIKVANRPGKLRNIRAKKSDLSVFSAYKRRACVKWKF